MSAQKDLMSAYATWRRWTEAERDAIQSANWPLVADCQTAKLELQPKITQLNVAAQLEWPTDPAERTRHELAVRSVVGELIQLETQNGENLAVLREKALTRMTDINRSQCNLQRVRQRYAPARTAAWSSFS